VEAVIFDYAIVWLFTRLCEMSEGSAPAMSMALSKDDLLAQLQARVVADQAALLKAHAQVTEYIELAAKHSREASVFGARVNKLARKCERYKEALDVIASWREGDIVNTSFDEPGSATIARQALSGDAE
jgi:hypothetical protein